MSRRMKDSGVEWIGEIPHDIDVISTKQILEFTKGKNPNSTNNQRIGKPYIGASDLEANVTIHEYESYSTDLIPEAMSEDTLVLWDGARSGLIGTGHVGLIGSTIMKVKPTVDYVDKKFWFWYLKGFQPVMLEWVGGTTIPHMSRDFIHDIQFLRFPLTEQQKIANYLDKKTAAIDHIIEKTKESIEDYKLYKQSLISEAVTKGLNPDVKLKDSGVEWIGEIPEHWEIHFLSQLFDQVKNKNSNNQETNLLSLSYGNIIRRNIESKEGLLPESFSGYNIIEKEDIVLRLTDLQNDQTSLRVGLSPEKGIITSAYITLRTRKKQPTDYYYLYLHTFDIHKGFYGMGSGVRQGLTYGGIKGIEMLSLPLDEQKAIAKYIEGFTIKIDKIITQKEQLIEDLEAYKKSLIYEVVTGKREVG